MSVTVRGSVVSNQAGGAISGNMSITVPTATVLGDYLLLILSCNKDTVTPAAGWTLLQNGSSASLAHQSILYGRVATATDVGGHTYTWNLSNSTAAPDVAVCWAFGNVDTTKVVSAKGAEDTTSPATTPAVTTTVPSLMVHLVADRFGSTPSITWTYPGGRTKTEGTNDGTTGYTASGAPNTATTVATGSQAGINITGSASPSTSFAYQVGLGDGLVAVPAADGSTNIVENAAVSANVPATEIAGSIDTAFASANVTPTGETGNGLDVATIRLVVADSGAGDEALHVVSGGSTIVFASDQAGSAEGVAPLVIRDGDTGGSQDSLQTALTGIQGPYPPGPRVIYVLPSSTG